MNPSVLLFFVHNVLATTFLGSKFATKKNAVIRSFGFALLLNGVAFAIWSVAVATRSENLETYVTAGTAFFLLALLAFLNAGIQNMNPGARRSLLAFGIVIGMIVFYIRAFVYPSIPSFSEEGLFFFNPHPIIQMIYIFGLAFTTLPAIDALATRFRSTYSMLIRYGFIAEVVGGVILITSTNTGAANSAALYLAGWIIGIVYFLLWTTFLFSKKAWSGAS